MGTAAAVFSTGDASASMRHRTIAWQRMNPTKLDDRQGHLRDVARPGRLAKVWSRIRRLTIPGVTQANISPTSLNSLLIPFPSLSPQRAMAATLNSAADTVGRLRKERNGLQSLEASTAYALLGDRALITDFQDPEYYGVNDQHRDERNDNHEKGPPEGIVIQGLPDGYEHSRELPHKDCERQYGTRKRNKDQDAEVPRRLRESGASGDLSQSARVLGVFRIVVPTNMATPAHTAQDTTPRMAPKITPLTMSPSPDSNPPPPPATGTMTTTSNACRVAPLACSTSSNVCGSSLVQ